jgi:hypothetical protein
MSIGSSGRVVVELDPQLKRRLYSALTAQGLSLKDWLIQNAERFLCDVQVAPLSQQKIGFPALTKDTQE